MNDRRFKDLASERMRDYIDFHTVDHECEVLSYIDKLVPTHAHSCYLCEFVGGFDHKTFNRVDFWFHNPAGSKQDAAIAKMMNVDLSKVTNMAIVFPGGGALFIDPNGCACDDIQFLIDKGYESLAGFLEEKGFEGDKGVVDVVKEILSLRMTYYADDEESPC